MMGLSRTRDDDQGLTREDVGRLYVSGRDDLFRLAWLAVDDAAVAEDLVQEAYTRLYEHPERVRDVAKVDAYVRSIVLNLARSRFTRRARRGHWICGSPAIRPARAECPRSIRCEPPTTARCSPTRSTR